MSNQNSPLKGFRPLKDSKTPSENPPNTTWKSSNPAPYQPPQQFSSSPNINPPQQKTICPYCSSPIPAGSSICLNCGNPVTQPNATSAAPTGNFCPHCRRYKFIFYFGKTTSMGENRSKTNIEGI